MEIDACTNALFKAQNTLGVQLIFLLVRISQFLVVQKTNYVRVY